jgi:hypothetical protein
MQRAWRDLLDKHHGIYDPEKLRYSFPVSMGAAPPERVNFTEYVVFLGQLRTIADVNLVEEILDELEPKPLPPRLHFRKRAQ